MNMHAVAAIYKFEMARMFRTVVQSIVAPVLSTSLYFVIFGAAIGSRITEIDGVSYGAFIVPGLIMLSLLTQTEAQARNVARFVQVFIPATSLGGVESLIEHRKAVEGPNSVVPPELLRISVGIEDATDLIADLEQALERA